MFGGGILAAVVLVGGATIARRRSPVLSGQLIALSGPPDQVLPLPLDLGASRTRQVHLGNGRTGEWRLVGWNGRLVLRADAQGQTRLTVRQGEVRINDMVVVGATALHDGDVVTCGEFRIRYENLLY